MKWSPSDQSGDVFVRFDGDAWIVERWREAELAHEQVRCSTLDGAETHARQWASAQSVTAWRVGDNGELVKI